MEGKNFRALFEDATRALEGNDWQTAESLLRQVLGQRPRFPEALHLLGIVCAQTGRLGEAVTYLRQAVAAKPYYVEAMGNLAAALVAAAVNSQEAEELLRQVVNLRPDHAISHSNLGRALHQQGRAEEAIASYRKALSLRPDFAETYYRLAKALGDLGDIDGEIAAGERALTLAPGMLDARNGLGISLVRAGRLDEALALFKQVMAADPGHVEAASNLVTAMNCDPGVGGAESAAAHFDWGRRHGAPQGSSAPFGNSREPERRLRVGYLSSDLWMHSVAFFLEPLLAGHRGAAEAGTGRVEAVCYVDRERGDAMTERLKKQSSGWVDAWKLNDDALAERVCADGIDIFVELGGHTIANRLRMLGRRVAPIQVSYLGYPNTTGVPAIDYRLTDALADPPGDADRWHSEKLWRLPRSFLCYRAPAVSPEVADRSHETGPPVFGCFNAVYKLNPQLLALWAEVMTATPGSRLLLKGSGMTSAVNRRRILEGLAAGGIAAERVELLEHTKGIAEHLGLYGRVDVALDTWPYAGTTTTCEALWMGVPVVTLGGEAHRSRVGVSLLTNVRLQELIGGNAEAFVQNAVELGRDRERINRLRAGMRQRMQASPLMDEPGFAREVEEAYRGMWRTWCESQK